MVRPEKQQAAIGIRIQICQTRGKNAISQDIFKAGIQIPPVVSYSELELCAAHTALNLPHVILLSLTQVKWHI
jgi:hypothetical protein